MRPVAPRIVGADEVQYDGDEYKALAIAKVPTEEGGVSSVTRWRLTPEERERIVLGDDLFLCVMGGQPPVQMYVGYPFGEIE